MNFPNATLQNSSQKLTQLEALLDLNAPVFTSNLILSLIFLLGIFFNTISIVFIILARAFTPINLLIINLGLADITYSLGIPFFISQTLNFDWQFGQFGCRIFIFTEFSGIIVGILTVAALSVERFYDVTDKNCSELSSDRLKPCFTILYSIFVWAFALCFSLPLISSIQLKKHNQNVFICQSDWDDSSLRIFFVLKLFLIFIFPYSVITFSSCKLLKFLNNWKKRFNKSAFSSRRTKSHVVVRQRKSSVQTSMVVIGCKYASIVHENAEDKQSEPTEAKINTNESNYQAYLQMANGDLKEQEENGENGEKFKIVEALVNLKKIFTRKKSTRRSLIKNRYLNSVRRKAIRLVLAINFLFIIQWSPFWIFQIVMLFSTSGVRNIRSINTVVSTLSYSNTVANPVLYMLLTYNFKEYLQKGFRNVPIFKRIYNFFKTSE
ncbi:Poly-cysteine and histidine-tailed [Brachionus plicatilis]|uniref:Poly-cysteine and histidine-tailed n=1 Tax=Brachionus plicatilis TaxID=10195 RepID=A0A3M7QXU3_BRAPC|nr:Poly-cysteine and histidine-tailed [Brachionus plicatilis]